MIYGCREKFYIMMSQKWNLTLNSGLSITENITASYTGGEDVSDAIYSKCYGFSMKCSV